MASEDLSPNQGSNPHPLTVETPRVLTTDLQGNPCGHIFKITSQAHIFDSKTSSLMFLCYS